MSLFRAPLALLLLIVAAAQPTVAGAACARETSVTSDGTLHARVECAWDIAPAAVESVVGPFHRHEQVFSVVKRSEALGRDSQGRALVRHVHTAPLITDREVVLAVSREVIPGGVRYAWEKAEPQPSPTDGRVEPIVNEGLWEIRPGPAGGTHLVYEAQLHPGGSVPSTLVSWLQGAALDALFDELERAARNGAGG